MNVFVLCTGRCGSTTFIKACSHISNFTALHESRSHLIGEARFAYPYNHIEADNRLSWLLGRLDYVYGDNAFYIHLTRNTQATAISFTKRYDGGIIKAYRGTGIIMGLSEQIEPLSVAIDYCKTVNSNISMFLKDKSKKLDFQIEEAKDQFEEFWSLIGAKGCIDSAMKEFDVAYNKSK